MFRIEGDNVLFVFLPIIDRMEERDVFKRFRRARMMPGVLCELYV